MRIWEMFIMAATFWTAIALTYMTIQSYRGKGTCEHSVSKKAKTKETWIYTFFAILSLIGAILSAVQITNFLPAVIVSGFFFSVAYQFGISALVGDSCLVSAKDPYVTTYRSIHVATAFAILSYMGWQVYKGHGQGQPQGQGPQGLDQGLSVNNLL